MNHFTGDTYIIPPYKIDVEITGNAIIQRIQNELEEGEQKEHYIEVFQTSISSFLESLQIPDGLSPNEQKSFHQIETTHPAFINWLAYYLTLQDVNKIRLILNTYSRGKYGKIDNFNNAIEFFLLNNLSHVPFDHHRQDEAVIKWIESKSYQSEDEIIAEEVIQTYTDVQTIEEITNVADAEILDNSLVFQENGSYTEIGIRKDWQYGMYQIFSPYIEHESKQALFKEVLKGKYLKQEHRITFNLKASIFCYAIKQIRSSGLYITSNKTLLSNWICSNFNFIVKGKIRPIKSSYCFSLLTSIPKEPNVTDIINIDLKAIWDVPENY